MKLGFVIPSVGIGTTWALWNVYARASSSEISSKVLGHET